MAALDFPSTPADNEIFRAPNGATWKWDDTRGLWISVGGVAKRRVSRFTGIAGDDTLSVVYNVGQIDVYYNGVKLDPNTDFTATNGTSVVLTDAVANDSDIIETIAWSNFDITEGLDITEGDARYSPITRARKNHVINGDMVLWQRGNSQTSSGYGSADRWSNAHSGTTKTASYEASDYSTLLPRGMASLKHVVTAGAGVGDYCYALQKIEFLGRYTSRTVTLSWYAKAGSALNMSAEILEYYGSGGSATVYQTPVKVTLGTTWSRYSLTVTLSDMSAKTFGTDNYLGVRFWFDAGSTYDTNTDSLGHQSGTFYITGVQLELGDTVTDFEYRTYGEELALCQRYYEVVVEPFRYQSLPTGIGSSYDGARFKVSKRANPTMTVIAQWNYYSSGTPTSFTPTFTGRITDYYWTVTGLTNWNGWAGSGSASADCEL